MNSGETTIDLGNVEVDLKKGYEVDEKNDDTAQTELYHSPTAYYQGDTQNKPGAQILNNKEINVEPLQGSFDSDFRVKLTNNNEVEFGDGTQIEYKYSLDGGENWIGTIKVENDSSKPVLDLPGGREQLSYAGNNDLTHSSNPNLEFELSGTRVNQMKQGVNMTTSSDFDDSKEVRIRINNDVTLGSGTHTINYKYTSDGGTSWSSSSTTFTDNDTPQITDDFDGVGPNETVKLRSQGQDTVDAGSESEVDEDENSVDKVPNLHSVAQGNFDQNVLVRIDEETTLELLEARLNTLIAPMADKTGQKETRSPRRDLAIRTWWCRAES